MGFNYAIERKKFDAEWTKMEKQLLDAGIDSEKVEEFYREELKVFGERRAYERRTQGMPVDVYEDTGKEKEEDSSPLMRKFSENFSVSIDCLCSADRMMWIEDIDNEALYKKLRKLSEKDLDVLTMLVMEEYTERDIAVKYGVTQSAVAQRIRKIKKILSET